jgi:hypothetical protein
MVVLRLVLFTLLVLFSSTRTPHLPSIPPISPNCYLPKSGRHVTSLDQGLSSSEARSGKSLGTRLVNRFFIEWIFILNDMRFCHDHYMVAVSKLTKVRYYTYRHTCFPGFIYILFLVVLYIIL